jgi:Sec-independent protein translocase protein TatA
MEFLGIGPMELVFILLIALILMGPKDMAKTGRTIGKTLRKVVTSPQWRTINQTSKEIRNLPTRLIREAGLEEVEQDLNNLKKTTADIQKTIRDSTILPPGWDKPDTASQKLSPTDQSTDEIRPSQGQTPADSNSENRAGQSTSSVMPEPNLSPWINHPDEDSPIIDYGQSERMNGMDAWITPPIIISSPPAPQKPGSSETNST